MPALSTLDPPPAQSPITTQAKGDANPYWLLWFSSLYSRIQLQPVELGKTSGGDPPVSLEDQNTAIGTSTITTPALTGVPIRLSWYLAKTTADGVASSVTLQLGWTESGLTKTSTGAALVTDTVLANQSGTILIVPDQATALTYATAYSSTTPNKMKYRLTIIAEQL